VIPQSINQNKILYSNNQFRFRVIDFNDIESIRNWRNDQKKVLRQNNNISIEDQKNYWYKHILPSFELKEPNQLLFSLEDCRTNELVAYGGLVHIDWTKKHAESSFLANTIYTKSIEEYETIFINYLDFLMMAAKQLQFSCIYSETYSFRTKHIKILEKYGYIQYGFLKKLVNSVNFSILHQYLLD
jgi:hypothetical protein